MSFDSINPRHTMLMRCVSYLYGFVMWLRRNIIYKNFRKPYTAPLPVISVGNLCMGGAGKTPMIEYLIRLLSPHFRIATLSRGYKRKTNGVIIANDFLKVDAQMIGDEPFQYYTKYKNILVAVSEKRAEGIQRLLKDHPRLQVVLLDDAFQHLKVNRSLNMLLTEYDFPYFNDSVFPSGNLREFRSASKAADLIIITKSPATLTMEEAQIARKNLCTHHKINEHQPIFFATLQYQPLSPFNAHAHNYDPNKGTPIVMLTGIAHPLPMQEYLETQYTKVIPLIFGDHHHYSPQDMRRIATTVEEFPGAVVVTTEKDAMRLLLPNLEPMLARFPVFTLPIEISFLFNEAEHFNQLIYDIIRKNSR